MNRRRWAIGCLAAALLVVATPVYLLFASVEWIWSQKLTLVVDTASGPVAASSVTRVRVHTPRFPQFHFPEARGAHIRITGEAVVAEVAPGKYLFALLNGDRGLDTAHLTQIFVDHPDFHQFPGGNAWPSIEELWPLRRKPGTRMEVSRKDYPLPVTFDDIADPKTVRRVDPDDLAAAFGPGVALQSIRLEITGEKVTKGKVEAVLGWIYDPKILKNPVWASLPPLTQTAIMGLRQPGGAK